MASFNIHKWRNNHIYKPQQQVLNENLWSKVKKSLSKIGTLTKGGTWDPWKGEKLKGKAEKEIGTLIDKGSESVIEDLDGELKEKYSEFPNMESNEEFTQGLEIIAAHYETIANAIEQGDLEQETGNYIIWDLRKYLEKLIDYDLSSIYRVFTEGEEEEDVLKGGRYSKTHGVFKSNKLPLSLALMGLSTYGLALIAQSDWLASILGSGEEVDIAEEAEAVFGNIEPGEGMTQIMSRLFDDIDLSPTSTGAEFAEAVDSIGGVESLEGIFTDPVAGTQAVEAVINNPNLAGAPLSNIFVEEYAGTGEQIGDMLVTKPGGTLAGTVVNIVTTMVAKQSVKAVAVAAFGNSVLAPLGISLATAGATIKAARIKGLTSSRLSAMEEVLFGMKFINAETPEREPEPEPEPGPEPGPKPKPEPEPELKDIIGGIREFQLTMIFQLIRPDIPLFSYLNQMKGQGNENKALDNITYVQSDWAKLSQTEEDTYPQEVKELAKVITNARKSPDMLSSRIAKILGIELNKRAKAASLSPGQAGKGKEIVGFNLEETHLFYEMLSEAAIDNFLDSANIKKNAGKILAFIGSMYASKDNITLGIVNADDLDNNIKNQIKDLGFTPITTGREEGTYVFLDAGDTGLHVGGKPQQQSTPQQGEFDQSKVFTTPKGIDEFPDELKDTKFYKEAIDDGWVFKTQEELPKGKYTILPIYADINNKVKLDYNELDYNQLKSKGKINPIKK